MNVAEIVNVGTGGEANRVVESLPVDLPTSGAVVVWDIDMELLTTSLPADSQNSRDDLTVGFSTEEDGTPALTYANGAAEKWRENTGNAGAQATAIQTQTPPFPFVVVAPYLVVRSNMGTQSGSNSPIHTVWVTYDVVEDIDERTRLRLWNQVDEAEDLEPAHQLLTPDEVGLDIDPPQGL